LQHANQQRAMSGVLWPFRKGARSGQPERTDRHLIQASQLFDEAWYRRKYPRASTVNGDPLEHFMSQGWKEGCDPGPYFSCASYLKSNPDVVTRAENPLLHYLKIGLQEGRKLHG
jgi:O-antigen biosynthesis protein